LLVLRPPPSTLFPYTTLFRSFTGYAFHFQAGHPPETHFLIVKLIYRANIKIEMPAIPIRHCYQKMAMDTGHPDGSRCNPLIGSIPPDHLYGIGPEVALFRQIINHDP